MAEDRGKKELVSESSLYSMSWIRGSHVAIGGGTRQGKTVGANQLFAESGEQFGLFFQPDPEPWLHGVSIPNAYKIKDAMKEGANRVVVALPMRVSNYNSHFQYCAELVMEMGEKRGIDSILVVDEAQEVSDVQGGDSLDWVLKRGLKRGVRCILVCQDFSTVSNKALRQCDYYCWVGPASGADVNYLQSAHKIDASVWRKNETHEYRVIDRSGREVGNGYFDNQRYGDG